MDVVHVILATTPIAMAAHRMGKCEGCESLYVIHLYTKIAKRRAKTVIPNDILGPGTSSLDGKVHVYPGIKHDGKSGKLYVTSASELLFKLQGLGPSERKFPRNAQGLRRRLRDGKFQQFMFLDEERGNPCYTPASLESLSFLSVFSLCFLSVETL